jgi:hypothetical protein
MGRLKVRQVSRNFLEAYILGLRERNRASGQGSLIEQGATYLEKCLGTEKAEVGRKRTIMAERRKGRSFGVSISPEGGWREGLDLEGRKGGKINKNCMLERYAINQQENKSFSPWVGRSQLCKRFRAKPSAEKMIAIVDLFE